MNSDRIDLEGAESVLRHTFTNRDIGSIALQPWRRGFSRLEFLGDSVLGLAVFTLAECAGENRHLASETVSNKSLDRLFFGSFAEFTSANTGDVIEASIGAVHIDAGFDAAATVATRICGVGDFDGTAVAERSTNLTPKGLRFIGAALTNAVVADHLCRTEPERNHQWFSETRSSLTRTGRIAHISRQGGFAPSDLGGRKSRDEAAADRFQEAVGSMFACDGWAATAPIVAELLGL